MKVHLFNPENDLALADGHPGYTPPARIRQMGKDLCDLPSLWAKEGDVVWDGDSLLHLQRGDEICPWGWSPALRHRLLQKGVDETFLPTEKDIEKLRILSHRRTAVEALRQLRHDGIGGQRLRGHATLCTSMEEVFAETKRWSSSLLKAPWSSSGKGLYPWPAQGAEDWGAHIIQQQGSVVVEEMLGKRCDFAMEFWKGGKGSAKYCGLSLFDTNANGAYAGNWLTSEDEKRLWLAQWIEPAMQDEILQWWTNYLSEFEYIGPVGVDMMICLDGGFCPCIEINWRQTMGMVSLLLAKKGYRGRFSVRYEGGKFSADIDGKSLL